MIFFFSSRQQTAHLTPHTSLLVTPHTSLPQETAHLLLRYTASHLLDWRGEGGRTALQWAVCKGDGEMVRDARIVRFELLTD